jgi:hypothetical protein
MKKSKKKGRKARKKLQQKITQSTIQPPNLPHTPPPPLPPIPPQPPPPERPEEPPNKLWQNTKRIFGLFGRVFALVAVVVTLSAALVLYLQSLPDVRPKREALKSLSSLGFEIANNSDVLDILGESIDCEMTSYVVRLDNPRTSRRIVTFAGRGSVSSKDGITFEISVADKVMSIDKNVPIRRKNSRTFVCDVSRVFGGPWFWEKEPDNINPDGIQAKWDPLSLDIRIIINYSTLLPLMSRSWPRRPFVSEPFHLIARANQFEWVEDAPVR